MELINIGSNFILDYIKRKSLGYTSEIFNDFTKSQIETVKSSHMQFSYLIQTQYIKEAILNKGFATFDILRSSRSNTYIILNAQ
jgi:hypothetical protein